MVVEGRTPPHRPSRRGEARRAAILEAAIDEFAENRLYEAHYDEGMIASVPLDLEPEFQYEIFVEELQKRFDQITELPYNYNFAGTRKLFLCEGKYDEVTIAANKKEPRTQGAREALLDRKKDREHWYAERA